LLLNNEKGGGAFLIPEGQKSSPSQRAVMVGQVWSAQLVETLLDMYSFDELFWFAREASEHRMSSDDGSGD
jgi:hypothetical protein